MGKKKNKKKNDPSFEIDLPQSMESGFNNVSGSNSHGDGDQINNATKNDDSVFAGPKE